MSLWLVDLALALTLVEALLLVRRPELLRTLLAGLGLMVALRLALADAAPHWLALALSAAGLCHAADLHARWRPRPLQASPTPLEKLS